MVRCSGGEGGGGGGGGVMTSMRMRLVFSFCFVDRLLIVLVVISGYFLLGFPHVDHAKTSRFCNFEDKTSKMTRKLNLKKHEKHGICDTFAKTLPKNKNEEHWKTKTPTHRVVDENLAKYSVFLISTKKPPQK